MSFSENSLMALDVGSKRIGVAQANLVTCLPRPCAVVAHDDTVIDSLKKLAQESQAVAMVVGLPRSLQGEETDQTRYVRAFVDRLREAMSSIPFYYQDEAGTTNKAKAELRERGHEASMKPEYSPDALAASYILEDFIQEGKHLDLLNKTK